MKCCCLFCLLLVKALQENEDDETEISRETVAGIIGNEGSGETFDRILQLVLADGAFIDGAFCFGLFFGIFSFNINYISVWYFFQMTETNSLAGFRHPYNHSSAPNKQFLLISSSSSIPDIRRLIKICEKKVTIAMILIAAPRFDVFVGGRGGGCADSGPEIQGQMLVSWFRQKTI